MRPCLRILQKFGHVSDLARLGERRDVDAGLPGHSDLQFREFVAEELQELVRDRPMHDQHLQSRAALAVERQGTEQALLHRKRDVGVGQNDRVLGIEAENGPQAVSFGMQLLEVIRDLARPDRSARSPCRNQGGAARSPILARRPC